MAGKLAAGHLNMDHSYSCYSEGTRLRERLQSQDHSYFSVGSKAPKVIQRKACFPDVTSRSDHIYGRVSLLAALDSIALKDIDDKENSLADGRTESDHTYGRLPLLKKLNSNTLNEGDHKENTSAANLELCTSPQGREDHTYHHHIDPCVTSPHHKLRQTTDDEAVKPRDDHIYCTAEQLPVIEGAVDCGWSTKGGASVGTANITPTDTESLMETSGDHMYCSKTDVGRCNEGTTNENTSTSLRANPTANNPSAESEPNVPPLFVLMPLPPELLQGLYDQESPHLWHGHNTDFSSSSFSNLARSAPDSRSHEIVLRLKLERCES